MKAAKYLPYILFFTISVTSSCQQKTKRKDPPAEPASTLNKPDYSFTPLSQQEADAYSNAVKEYYEAHLKNTGFNGAILVAKNGQVLFEEYKGYINFKTKEPITPETSFHLASISKTFTGMTILRLWEEGRLSLNDPLQKYFPKLPYKGISLRMLLDHRSGLPNYLNFMDSCWNKRQKATNQDVLNFMIVHKPRVSNLPNKAYNYCNTNFMLLALVIEKITGIPYPKYMEDSVFKPLGLTHTWVFTQKDTANYVPTYIGTRPYPMDHLDCTYGDKNIYSTVRDLFTWDKALYQHTFISRNALDSAFTPYSNEHHSMHNYGLAWHLYFNKGDTIVYHNGKWHGENNSFTRLVQSKATIIVLGNKADNYIFRMKNMSYIFTGQVDTTELKE